MTDNRKSYSNARATFAIAKASFRSIIRSPSAVVFSLAFPLVFIIVFANIGGGGITADVGVAKTCDTANDFYHGLKTHKVANLITNQSTADMESNLSKGNLAAIIDIKKSPVPPYITVNTMYSTASGDKGNIFKMILTNIAYNANRPSQVGPSPIVELSETTIKGREYKYIDFLLPGMLGFSLLSSGVFGTAFVFISLRLTLVIKRFFATPVKKYSIVLGEAIARLIFSWIGALFIIMVGHFFFGFTLIHGAATVINMLILSALGLI
ncbi:MAG: ABC transporter permease, partial [Mucilaginibacter sp.]